MENNTAATSAPIESTATESVEAKEVQDDGPSDNDGYAPTKREEERKPKIEDEIRAKNIGEEEKPKAPPAPQKHKVKVNGQEREVTIEELMSNYSKGSAADQKFAEAAQMRKQAEEFVSLLRKDPRKVLENPNIGVNLREFAEKYLSEQLEAEMLSPEQKKLREYETKLKEYQQQEEEKKQQELTAKQEAEVQHWKGHYEKIVQDALNVGGLPKTTGTVRMMAAHMQRATEYGIDIHPNELVQLVKQDYMNAQKELYSSLEGDALLQILGDELANKIRKADLSRLRKPVAGKAPEVPVAERSAPSEEDKPKKHLSIHEWREELEKKLR